MNIVISVGGRFHAFNLAQQLEKRGHLQRIITSYPVYETAKYGIPRKKIKSVLIKEVLERGWKKMPQGVQKALHPQFLIHEIFDKGAKKRLDRDLDIFVGWSSFSLHSLREAKKLGAAVIVERGSSHILFQNNILKEEYEASGARVNSWSLPHPKIIDKELREYEEADFIQVPSTFAKNTFLEYGVPKQKIISTPYGVDLSEFRQMPKKDDVFRVVFAGGMTLQKGVHYLLEAFAGLDLPNSELVLIGSMDDEMKPFFRKYAGSYNYIGHVPQRELYKHYSQGSVFCIASIQEGLALVQAQAMACGLPVICTTNTGGEDIVRDGTDGFVIPIRDVVAIREKLVYFYEHPEARRQMGESAKGRVASGFAWDDYGEKVERTYESIIADRSGLV